MTDLWHEHVPSIGARRHGVLREKCRAFAEALQTANQFLGNPNAVNGQLDRYMKVTTADVKRVAETYLRPDNSLTLLISAEATP